MGEHSDFPRELRSSASGLAVEMPYTRDLLERSAAEIERLREAMKGATVITNTASAEITRLTELAYTPDGKEMRRALFEEAEQRQRLTERCEKLHVIAKNVSHALMSFTPGGSEYFTRVQVGDFEDYYADADFCQQRVRERINGAEERARILTERIGVLESALHLVRGIIKDGAMTGFNCKDGDWAERLFASQATTHAALSVQVQAGAGESKPIADQIALAAARAKLHDVIIPPAALKAGERENG